MNNADLAQRIATAILTMHGAGSDGEDVVCQRAALMHRADDVPYEVNLGGRNHNSIASVVLEHLEACRESQSSKLVGYILSVRRENTKDWMEGLADELNRWAEATGDPDRVATHRDGLQVITPIDVAETMPD